MYQSFAEMCFILITGFYNISSNWLNVIQVQIENQATKQANRPLSISDYRPIYVFLGLVLFLILYHWVSLRTVHWEPSEISLFLLRNSFIKNQLLWQGWHLPLPLCSNSHTENTDKKINIRPLIHLLVEHGAKPEEGTPEFLLWCSKVLTCQIRIQAILRTADIAPNI